MKFLPVLFACFGVASMAFLPFKPSKPRANPLHVSIEAGSSTPGFVGFTPPGKSAINQPARRSPLISPLSLAIAYGDSTGTRGINPLVITEPSLVKLLETPALPLNSLVRAQFTYRPAGAGRTTLVGTVPDEYETAFQGPYAYFSMPGEYEILLSIPQLSEAQAADGGMDARISRGVSDARYIAEIQAPSHDVHIFSVINPFPTVSRLDLDAANYRKFPRYRSALVTNAGPAAGTLWIDGRGFPLAVGATMEVPTALLGRHSLMSTANATGGATFQGVISYW